MKRLIIYSTGLLALCGGCASEVLLFVMQPATNLTGGEKLYFDIEARTINGYVDRMWRSETGVRFAKVNAFDYAGATRSAVASLYENSRCDEFVDALAIDDVILLGRGDHAWGVLKIVAIFDEPGSTADRYLFDLKTVAN